MRPCRPITLTTDFGTRDWFVGTMKGVIQRIAPQASVTDLTHEIPPADIPAAAFALTASYRFFPKGTIHVVVVDPGVGSARKALAVRTSDYCFIGPDNGVLSWALAREKITSIRTLENPTYFLQPVSQTFHGRDIFSPVAAHLSRGVAFSKLGSPQKDLVRLPWPAPRCTRTQVEGEVVYIDRFGNAITNVDAASLKLRDPKRLGVYLGRKRLCSLAPCYSAVPTGRPVAVLGSSGFIELAINGGNAAQTLRLKMGLPVRIAISN